MIKVVAKLDTVLIDELEQYVMNNTEIGKEYDKLVDKFAKMVKSGTFNKQKAIQSFMIIVNNGAEKYNKDYGTPKDDWKKMFPINERKAVAESLTETFLMESDMKIVATEKSEETGGLIAKFGKLNIGDCKKAIESGNYEGAELEFIQKKLKAMGDMKDGGLESKASRKAISVNFGGQAQELLNYGKEFLTYMNELQKDKQITTTVKGNDVFVKASSKKVFDEIVKNSTAMKSKASNDIDFTTLATLEDEVTADMTKNEPLKSENSSQEACNRTEACGEAKELLTNASELGLVGIIASEISEKTGGLIAKFGKLKYEDTKEAIESGEHEGEDLDFLEKKLAGMERMKSGEMAGRGPSVTANEDIKLLEEESEDKVSDIVPNSESFADDESTIDLIPTATKF